MNQRAVLVFCSLFSTAYCGAQVNSIDMPLLYESPESYQGTVISVEGLLLLSFEGELVCKYFQFKKEQCLELDLSNFERESLAASEEVLVRIEGEFRPQDLDYERQGTNKDGTLFIRIGGPFHHKLIRIRSVSKL